jgi:hypothetical protein
LHILVDADSVIRTVTQQPIRTGIEMVGALSGFNNVTFITHSQKEDLARWLDVHKIVDFDNIIDKSAALLGQVIYERQIQLARTRGNVDLVVTGNPLVWVYAFEQGIPSVMFGSPEYSRVEFRPDAPKKVRSWDDIVAAVDKQNELRTKDARLARTDSINFGVGD